MSLDKLVDSAQLDADLEDIADAIRSKGGTSAQLAFPADFVTAIGNISGGGGSDGVAANATTVKLQYATGLASSIIFQKLTTVPASGFGNISDGLEILVLPAVSSMGNYVFSDSSSIKTVDLGTSCPNLQSWYFSGAALSTLIIRKNSVVTLGNINAFNNTPFASGKSGGTLYVPSSLISSYESASNWSTILGYANNSIQSIEGSIYENAYADGTPIS